MFGPQRCKQLFKTNLENIKILISQFQQKAKTLKSQTETQSQTPISYQINIKKFEIIYNYLKQEYYKFSALKNKDFDPEIIYTSQTLQAIEDYAGKLVRFFQIQALQNEQNIKTKIKLEKQKLSFLEQAKVQPPKEDKDKKNKQSIKKSLNTREQPFKKPTSGNQGRKDPKSFKKPMELIVNPQNSLKPSSTQIFIDHIQNLTQTIQSLQKILTDDQFHGAISFKQPKVFFTNENLNQIEERNARFEYVIDEYCDINGFKPLIKRKEVNANLPKMKSIFLQETKDAYYFKSILEHIKGLKAMCEFKQVKAIPNSPKFRPPEAQIDSYVDSFNVTFITSSQFYQGQLRVYNYHLCKFVENKDIDPGIYGNLMALESQQRKKTDIQKAPLSFYIKFDKNQDEFIKKSYLKVEKSIEIYASNRSYLFVFRDQKQRDLFCKKIYQKNEINPENVDIYIKLWQKGIISNFEYLMFLNKHSQRSFSDISQYYVFPWTVCNYKSETMDNEFLGTAQNFRDLSEPIGKINKIKFKKIMSHFESSKRFMDPDRPNFLYGSFYSNPAITSYYLIRLYPFSAHQHELQNYRFDHPDRLFGSVEKNFDAVYNITGDFKELIPQFYSSPYFLKNRNRYNFGRTQSKVLIDDVELPSWVRTQTPQQFIFRMRKCLESQEVTMKLQKWIDLTFGVYAERSNAIKKDNLYNQYVYGTQKLMKDSKNLSFCSKYLKEFGQIPKTILKSEHPESLMKKKGRKLIKKSKSLQDLLKETLTKQDIKEYAYDDCEKLNQETESSLIKFVSKEKAQKQQKGKSDPKSAKKIPPPTQADQPQADPPFLMLKQNCLIAKCSYGFGYYIFPLDNKDSSEYKCRLTTVQKCDFLTIDHAKSLQTYLLTIENGSLCGYRFVSKMSRGFKSSIGDKIEIEMKEDVKVVRSMGSYLILVNTLDEVKLYTTQLTQNDRKLAEQISKDPQRIKNQDILKLQNFILPHTKTIKADFEQISDIYVNSYLSIFCIRNKANTFYIFDAREDMTIDFRTNFQIYLMFEERIKHVLIHNMGYVLILTSKNRLLLVNLLAEIVLNILVSFDVSKDIKQTAQTIEAVCFWSQEASDIVFSTNKNILYKVDIFDMAERRKTQIQRQPYNKKHLNIDEFEILKESAQNFVQKYQMADNKQKIVDMKMERTGRHWKMYCLGGKGNIFTLKNKHYDITKCMKIFLRERQD